VAIATETILSQLCEAASVPTNDKALDYGMLDDAILQGDPKHFTLDELCLRDLSFVSFLEADLRS